jgi:hypothetical protein
MRTEDNKWVSDPEGIVHRVHETLRQPEHQRRGIKRIGSIWASGIDVDSNITWLVKDLIPAGGLVEIYGQPSCGKSFLALDLGMAIARGRPFFGREVMTPGFVAFIAAEGGHGVKKRVVAYRKYHGIEDDDEPFLLIPEVLNFRNSAEVDALVALLEECSKERGPCRGLITDTVNRSFGGGDENASRDMGEYLQAVDRIGQATGAARILIHHEGKDRKGSGGRGHSSLFAATDTAILVEKYEGVHSFTLERQKDGDDGAKFGFRLDQFEMGTDADNDAITSLIVEPTDLPKGKRTHLTRKNAAALTEFADLLNRGAGHPHHGSDRIPPGVEVIDIELWRETLHKRSLLDGKNPRQQFKDIKAALLAAGKIGIWEEQAWIVKT